MSDGLPEEDLMNELIEQKWVRVMADHSADPLWDREGLMVGLDELPVSAGLIKRLGDWAAWYEKNRDWDGDYSFDFATFAAAGLEIARSVKAELQDWTVFYLTRALTIVTAMRRAKPLSMKFSIPEG